MLDEFAFGVSTPSNVDVVDGVIGIITTFAKLKK